MAQDEPKEIDKARSEYAIKRLKELKFNPEIVSLELEKTEINFILKGNVIKLFPYTGWFQGKGLKADRGIHKLIKQIKNHDSRI